MDDAVELVSDGWCKVRRPAARRGPHPAVKQERVSAWVASLPSAVRYEPLRAAHRANNSPLKSVARCRSLSDASLADFLQCQTPCRPSFLDPPRQDAPRGARPPPRRRVSTRATPHDSSDVHRLGGAEFLSRALSHFSDFHSLDFSHSTPASSATITPDSRGFSAGSVLVSPEKPAGPGYMWSFVAGFLGDFARDITFIQ
ncbi:hypothetical protein H4R19_002010 [Coemansia spiralis]|nr:hypothetical protein H4R19_002010 [Coemansia spiralis]